MHLHSSVRSIASKEVTFTLHKTRETGETSEAGANREADEIREAG